MPALLSYNARLVSVEAAGMAIGEDITHVAVFTARNGGNLLFSAALVNDPDALESLDRLVIAAGQIRYRQPEITGSSNARESNHLSELKLNGIIAADRWCQFCDGDPGADGSANHMNLARVMLARASFLIVRE